MKHLFETFSVSNERQDEFYSKDNQPDYAELLIVIKLILVLSHGNAAVENGFSVNGGMLVENLHEA